MAPRRHRPASSRTRPRTGPAFPSEADSRPDQLPRGGQLRVAAVELSVELAPPYLRQDLPHPRRLLEPQVREVGAADLEANVAQPLEVRMQRLEVGERQREEGRVGSVRLGRGDAL